MFKIWLIFNLWDLRIYPPMQGVRSFILGFSLSLASMSAYGQLFYSSVPNKFLQPLDKDIRIDLFKAKPENSNTVPVNIFANIQKTSVSTQSQPVEIQKIQTAESYINAPEDDEILSINIDGIIPIEFDDTTDSAKQAEIIHLDDEEISAMLPTQISDSNDFSADTPWIVAKGSKHIKNKQLLEDLGTTKELPKLADNFILTLENNEETSYKVAEKIKSSLLFPIPSEILNDENLIPTFIKKTKQTSTSAPKQPPLQKAVLPATPTSDNLKIVPKAPSQTAEKDNSSKGLLNSISSWFSSDGSAKSEAPVKSTPSYSSQGKTPQPQTRPSSNNEFVNFYKTLQETSAAHKNNAIIPSELKLSFQPERAEISGQTLRWLKAFSEAAQNEDTYLQVRLDASASTELQKKRLNLLYTIFMNNGVDFKKIDTVFSLTEPNAFIIRTLKLK